MKGGKSVLEIETIFWSLYVRFSFKNIVPLNKGFPLFWCLLRSGLAVTCTYVLTLGPSSNVCHVLCTITRVNLRSPHTYYTVLLRKPAMKKVMCSVFEWFPIILKLSWLLYLPISSPFSQGYYSRVWVIWQAFENGDIHIWVFLLWLKVRYLTKVSWGSPWSFLRLWQRKWSLLGIYQLIRILSDYSRQILIRFLRHSCEIIGRFSRDSPEILWRFCDDFGKIIGLIFWKMD